LLSKDIKLRVTLQIYPAAMFYKRVKLETMPLVDFLIVLMMAKTAFE